MRIGHTVASWGLATLAILDTVALGCAPASKAADAQVPEAPPPSAAAVTALVDAGDPFHDPSGWAQAAAAQDSARTVQGPSDAAATATVVALLASEGKGKPLAVPLSIAPERSAAPAGVVLLPTPASLRWTQWQAEHEMVASAANVVVVSSRIRAVLQPHDIPMVLHHALVATVDAGAVTEVTVYVDPLEVGPVAMGFRRLGSGELAENETGGKLWGPSRSWCCQQPPDAEAQVCWMLDGASTGHCNRTAWNEYSCRHRQGCVGEHCFCCTSGVDAACEPEPKAEPPRWRPGRSRRPAAGTIWSPF